MSSSVSVEPSERNDKVIYGTLYGATVRTHTPEHKTARLFSTLHRLSQQKLEVSKTALEKETAWEREIARRSSLRDVQNTHKALVAHRVSEDMERHQKRKELELELELELERQKERESERERQREREREKGRRPRSHSSLAHSSAPSWKTTTGGAGGGGAATSISLVGAGVASTASTTATTTATVETDGNGGVDGVMMMKTGDSGNGGSAGQLPQVKASGRGRRAVAESSRRMGKSAWAEASDSENELRLLKSVRWKAKTEMIARIQQERVLQKAKAIEVDKTQLVEGKIQSLQKKQEDFRRSKHAENEAKAQKADNAKLEAVQKSIQHALSIEKTEQEQFDKIEKRRSEMMSQLADRRKRKHELELEHERKNEQMKREEEEERLKRERELEGKELRQRERDAQTTALMMEKDRERQNRVETRRKEMEDERVRREQELTQKIAEYDNRMYDLQCRREKHRLMVADLMVQERKLRDTLQMTAFRLSAHGVYDPEKLEKKVQRELSASATAYTSGSASATASGSSSRDRSGIVREVKCALCLVPHPADCMSNTTTQKNILDIRKRWGVAKQFNQNKGMRAGTMYDSVHVCVFCFQFFATDDSGD
eukprot:ANDGO_01827.mRNA.1 hypothetical protein